MRKRLMGAAALAAVLLLPLAAQAPRAEAVVAQSVATAHARVIVKYRADSPLLKKQAMTAAGRRNLQSQALGDRIGVALTAGRGITARSQVVFADGITSSALAARLAAQSDVEYAVVDGRKHIVAVPNDSYYNSGPALGPTGGPVVGQWYLKPPGAATANPTANTSNTAPSSINAEQAWDVLTSAGVTGSSVVVAVIDTGVRFDHVDLQGGNVLPGYDMISDDRTSGDNEPGRDSDALDPGDYVTQADITAGAPGCTSSDVGTHSSWHGTQTLGLIGAATGNGIGIASVGHGQVKVMPVRALGKCGGDDSDIVAAMYWAAGLSDPDVTSLPVNPHPARVISMSLGGIGSCEPMYVDAMTALTAAGVTVVAAAGNESAAAADTPSNCPGVIAVAAVRSHGDKVGFSNIDPSRITIAAPGGNCGNDNGTGATSPCQYPIMSTSNSGTTTPVSDPNGGSIYTDALVDPSIGTSFSTPLVAGTVALMIAVQPSLTPSEIVVKLKSTARAFPNSGSTLSGSSPPSPPPACSTGNSSAQSNCYCPNTAPLVCGAGMLDAHAAVLAALGVQARITVDTATPTASQAVSLSSSSLVSSGQAIATYAWTITSAGSTGATITGASNASTVSIMPASAGTFTIQLATTDAFGVTSTASASVVVAAAGSTGGGAPTGSSSGGGGALGAGWLLLLLADVAALAVEDRLQRRRRRLALASAAVPTRRG